jgi:hypothetical protein
MNHRLPRILKVYLRDYQLALIQLAATRILLLSAVLVLVWSFLNTLHLAFVIIFLVYLVLELLGYLSAEKRVTEPLAYEEKLGEKRDEIEMQRYRDEISLLQNEREQLKQQLQEQTKVSEGSKTPTLQLQGETHLPVDIE